MAKKPSLPVASKKAVPVRIVSDYPSETSSTNKDYEARERMYRAKRAAETLAEAAQIKKDKSLMKDVKSHIKDMTKACS